MNRISTSVIVTTFDSPVTLTLVLRGLVRQTERPDEVLVADDGSGPSTAAALDAVSSSLPFPLFHVWQPHDGFRAARSRNNAIARARGARLAFLDQDTIPHARWLKCLCATSRAGTVSIGDAVSLGSSDAASVDASQVDSGSYERHFAGGRSRLLKLHLRYCLYAALRRIGWGIKAKPRLRSCNFAAWRTDLVAVNGFDEAYVGWGQEDDDLGRRLYRAGVKPDIRIFNARVLHLPHPPRRPAEWATGANADRYAASKDGPARCEVGLSRHPYPDVRCRSVSV